MFQAKTQKIEEIAKKHQKVLAELERLLENKVAMYIDYANVRPWAEKLGWHIDLKRLKQFLNSFDNVIDVKFYAGTLVGDAKSGAERKVLEGLGYNLRTKPVKIMRFSIDTTSILKEDTSLLDQFIRKSLLRKYRVETIEYLNDRFTDMNKIGELYIEDRKCNFDVEIGVDMLLDAERQLADTYVLWSGDSDFHDPILKLLEDGKKVILFATARRISRELNDLRKEGLVIFDIQKMRNFICWNREIQQKGLPMGSP